MKASEVKVRDLESYEQCDKAIESIEGDYLNVIGGFKAWCSGYETHLTESAKKKIEAIKRKQKKLDTEEYSV